MMSAWKGFEPLHFGSNQFMERTEPFLVVEKVLGVGA